MPFRKLSKSANHSALRPTLRALLVLIIAIGMIAGVLAYTVVRRGLSAHEEPSSIEAVLARTMRRLATPASVRGQRNPVQTTDAVLGQGLEHYADHCASCHANDGSGDTEIGRGLYPRVPDMRGSDTQSLSDGELFSIIEHGIRLTGMPAWGTGTPEGERDSWALVHFIRRLPTLTESDITRMEQLNPKTAEQWREEEEARRFLAGEDAKPAPAAPHEHDGSR